METPIEQARWRRSQIAEAVASSHVSAPCYRLPKDVVFVAIVESESKLRKVQRQIFLAHVVVSAHDPALQERPERFDVVRVNQAANVLALAVADRLMRQSLPAIQILVAGMLIGRDQFNLAADGFRDKAVKCRHIGMLDHLADHVSLAS